MKLTAIMGTTSVGKSRELITKEVKIGSRNSRPRDGQRDRRPRYEIIDRNRPHLMRLMRPKMLKPIIQSDDATQTCGTGSPDGGKH